MVEIGSKKEQVNTSRTETNPSLRVDLKKRGPFYLASKMRRKQALLMIRTGQETQ